MTRADEHDARSAAERAPSETIWHITRDGTPAVPGAEPFVHASFTSQLAETLALHFVGVDEVVLLRLDSAALGARLVCEPSRGGALFPHVYGRIEPSDVLGRVRVARGADGAFDLAPLRACTPDLPAFLALQPLPVPRPWGGRRIAPRFGWTDPGPVGEWWLLSCHPSARTELRDGGTLAAWLDAHAGAGLPRAADFPLLLKFLDADEVLSVQVHPDDATARSHGMANGKTEAWLVLDAEPGAKLWLGTADGVRPADVLAAVRAGADDDEVKALLRAVEPRAGDALLVPAGTIHAIGPGLAIYEVQQTSDATYRLYDWGRGREVHLELGEQAARDHRPSPPANAGPARGGWTTLLDDAAFRLSRARPEGALAVRPARGYAALTVLAGTGELRATPRVGESAADTCALRPGDTALVLRECAIDGDGLDLLLAEPGA
ncbi:MAG: DUF952 domain-containing protein [Planctomycetes bacterium]|nr:DUF952 domain-containing protein [Planctomycetota bacterium]